MQEHIELEVSLEKIMANIAQTIFAISDCNSDNKRDSLEKASMIKRGAPECQIEQITEIYNKYVTYLNYIKYKDKIGNSIDDT